MAGEEGGGGGDTPEAAPPRDRGTARGQDVFPRPGESFRTFNELKALSATQLRRTVGEILAAAPPLVTITPDTTIQVPPSGIRPTPPMLPPSFPTPARSRGRPAPGAGSVGATPLPSLRPQKADRLLIKTRVPRLPVVDTEARRLPLLPPLLPPGVPPPIRARV